MKPELSIVIPCYNEQDNIEVLYKRIEGLVSKLPPFEVIFVDDGSRDKTAEYIHNFSTKLSPGFDVKLVRLSRNFGHQLALLAGMRAADGRCCVSMDADLQDPPEVIIDMIAEWKLGADVVLGRRSDRTTDSFFKRTTAHVFYKIMSYLTRGEFPAHVGDFRLVDRKVLDVLTHIQEPTPYWRGLVVWVGFRRALVSYKRDVRHAGETKYPFLKMFKFATDAMFSFSRKPLEIVSWLGIFMSVAAMGLGFVYIAQYVFGKSFVPGWASIVSLVVFIGGIQLVCLGIIGQYVGRIYEQVLGRPNVLTFPTEIVHQSHKAGHLRSLP